MRGWIGLNVLFIVLGSFSTHALSWPFQESKPPIRLQVAEAFIDLHTGPASGYPSFYSAERGDSLTIQRAHTEWYRVETGDGTTGWVHWDDLEQSLEQVAGDDQFIEKRQRDYQQGRLAIGFYGGYLLQAPLLGARATYRFNDTFSAELDWAEVADDFSTSTTYHINLLWHPIRYWALNPYFMMGAGSFKNSPDTSVSNASDTRSDSTLVGIGAAYRIDRRISWHLAYKNHFVYIGDDQQGSYQEWSTGINYQIGSLANNSLNELFGYGVDTDNIEVGVYTGSYSIEDFTANATSGLYLSYHVSESFFFQATRADTDISDRSYRELGLPVLTDTGGGASAGLRYLNLAIGYNAFPGEVVLEELSNWKLNLYFTFGVGRTEFQRRNLFSWALGTGVKVKPGQHWAYHLGLRDHMYEFDILGEDKSVTHNLETLFAVSFNF